MGSISGGGSDFIDVGGRRLYDLTNLKILHGTITTAGNYGVLMAPGLPGTAYVVPASTQFRVVGILMGSESTGMLPGAFYYCDNDIGYHSASAGTNPVFFGAATMITNLHIGVNWGSMENGAPVDYLIPAGKYPAIRLNLGGCSVKIYGYEEAV